MREWIAAFPILFLVIAIAICLWFYLAYRRSRLEYSRLESSLQHERYSHRLLVDFMRAIEKSLSEHNSAGGVIEKQTI